MTVSRRVVEDPGALARAGADRILEAAREALSQRQSFSLVLSGGSTPKAIYEILGGSPDLLDWSRVEIFFGDERCVPPEHKDSNYRMAREALLDKIPIPKENVHRIRGEADPALAAREYEDLLLQKGLGAGKLFDLVLLGMGADGHTASLFPETPALAEETRWVVSNYVEKLGTNRVTLTARALLSARAIVFFIAGQDKADTLQAVLEGELRPKTYPSQLIFSSQAPIEILLDRAAAAKLSLV